MYELIQSRRESVWKRLL